MGCSNHQPLLLFTLLFALSFKIAFSLGEIPQKEQDSEELENPMVKSIQDDYLQGFVELLNFVNTINNTLIALNKDIGGQKADIDSLKSEIACQKAEIADQKAEIADQKVYIVGLKSEISGQRSEIGNLKSEISGQKVKLVGLKYEIDRQKAESVGAKTEITGQQAEIVSIKSEIAGQSAEIVNLKFKMGGHNQKIQTLQLDVYIQMRKADIKIGSSYNKSTSSDIKSRASQRGQHGSYTVVVFVNHLDETIQDFKIYDRYTSSYSSAPKSIPQFTQEIFTFARPEQHWVDTSFSFAILSKVVRIAVISHGGALEAGLAFVRSDAGMRNYYETKKGIEGSSAHECCEVGDKNLSVRYKNLHARMFADYDGNWKGTLRIELIKFPMQD